MTWQGNRASTFMPADDPQKEGSEEDNLVGGSEASAGDQWRRAARLDAIVRIDIASMSTQHVVQANMIDIDLDQEPARCAGSQLRQVSLVVPVAETRSSIPGKSSDPGNDSKPHLDRPCAATVSRCEYDKASKIGAVSCDTPDSFDDGARSIKPLWNRGHLASSNNIVHSIQLPESGRTNHHALLRYCRCGPYPVRLECPCRGSSRKGQLNTTCSR
jgi:hypothetical protein